MGPNHGGVVAAKLRGIGQHLLFIIPGDWPVVRRHHVIGGALKYKEFAHHWGNGGNYLHRRRPGADDPHHLVGKRHIGLGPIAGVIERSMKVVQASNIRHVG